VVGNQPKFNDEEEEPTPFAAGSVHGGDRLMPSGQEIGKKNCLQSASSVGVVEFKLGWAEHHGTLGRLIWSWGISESDGECRTRRRQWSTTTSLIMPSAGGVVPRYRTILHRRQTARALDRCLD
jgi:hypothetical protein